jgi:hypothetical protein
MENLKEEVIKLWSSQGLSIDAIQEKLGIIIECDECCVTKDEAITEGKFEYHRLLLG